MKCSDFQDIIFEFIYGDLQPARAEEVQIHLKGCSTCRDEHGQIIRIKGFFSKVADLSPSDEVFNRVLEVARRRQPSLPINPINERWSYRRRPLLAGLFEWVSSIDLRPIAPVAVMAVMILAVMVLFSTPHQITSLSQNSMAVPPSGQTDLNGSLIANEAALRERLLVNPFEFTQTSFNLKERSPIGLKGGVSSGFRNVALEDDDSSLANIEAQLKERRRMLLESDADTLMMRGRRLKALGRIDLALKDFETIYRFYPDYSYMGDILMYRAQCYAFLGNYDKALESLNIYVKKFPDKESIIQNMVEQLKNQKAHEIPPVSHE